ncbi:Spondin-1 [Exaiptasia diaphana]|nr:Spondin-1 [Exaiptasia diaphana]
MGKELVVQAVLVLHHQVQCVTRIAVGWTAVGPGRLGALAAGVGFRLNLEELSLEEAPLVEAELARRRCHNLAAVTLASMKLAILLPALLVFNLFLQTQSWFFVKRRRRSCSPSNCRVSSWGSWSSCSKSCGGGTQGRVRYKTVGASCGGSCNYNFQETRTCNVNCCPVNCVYSWGSWSSCSGCGKSTQSRSPNIKVRPSCGGRSCPGKQSRSCDTGVLGLGPHGVPVVLNVPLVRVKEHDLLQSLKDVVILLSGSSSVAENQPRGTKVGTFSSIDSVNSKDTHTYAIVKGGNGLFELKGADLLTLKIFNYESSPNSFDITIRSTDNGVPAMHLDKTFTIKVTDVNESPTDIQLSSTSVDENSDMDTTVGMLSTADPDKSQSFTYLLLDNAGGRFKVVKNLIKVHSFPPP